jgi:hypothetical protein
MLKSRQQSVEVSLEQCLDDVETRFLFNLPEAELSQSDRLFFQIEQAWWFYVRNFQITNIYKYLLVMFNR